MTFMIAEMVGKKHCDLLRNIRKYTEQLGESKIAFTDFFKDATYITVQNKILPCFQVTKKGCEFIAHKLTGPKGTEFIARYINRFVKKELSGELSGEASMYENTPDTIKALAELITARAKLSER